MSLNTSKGWGINEMSDTLKRAVVGDPVVTTLI